MRLICPHCQVSVTVSDTAAGTPTPCPQCNQSITLPALTGAAIDAAPVPPPPPSRIAPAPAVAPAPSPAADLPRLAEPSRSGVAPWLRLTLRREVAQWLAPGALILAFILTCFTWAAVAPNGTRVYTQNAWQAAGGWLTPDSAGDSVMKAETELKAHLDMSVWLLFYLILLIPTAAVAIADRVLSDNPAAVPDIFRAVWPHRRAAVAGLCAVLVLLLILPLTLGFGLQTAALAAAEAAVPAALSAAGKPEPTTAEKTERDLHRDLQVARFGLQRTVWLKLALAAQLVALIGAGMAVWLDRHPAAPDPRLEVYC
jgi:hypothetical protein